MKRERYDLDGNLVDTSANTGKSRLNKEKTQKEEQTENTKATEHTEAVEKVEETNTTEETKAVESVEETEIVEAPEDTEDADAVSLDYSGFITQSNNDADDERADSYYVGTRQDVNDYIIPGLADADDFDDGYTSYRSESADVDIDIDNSEDDDDDEIVIIGDDDNKLETQSDEEEYADDIQNIEYDDIQNIEYADDAQDTKYADDVYDEFEEEPAPVKRPANRRKRQRSNKVLIGAVCGALALVVVIGGVCMLMSGGNDLGQNNTIVTEPLTQPITDEFGNIVDPNYIFESGITVCGVDLSGKTLAQAREDVAQAQSSCVTPLDITVVANGKTIKLSEKDFEYTYNTDEVISLATKYSKQLTDGTATEDKAFDITATINEESIATAVDKIAQKVDVEVVQAHVSQFKPFEKDKFTYAEGEKGLSVNQATLVNDIDLFIKSGKTQGRIDAKITEVEPTITVDMVKKNIVPLSTYSTYSTNTANGNENMRLSLAACNGSVIEPGATWSFNACTGDSNLESNGYKPATVISNGQYEQGIGGGICQSSTTIYYAAIYANMDIAERYNHKWASSYAAAGLDATIDYPNLDLKLKNSTDYQMFMECKMSGNKLTVNIYGYKDPSYDVIATYSETCNITDDTFDAKAYRIYYKDGKEVSREQLPSSTYSLSDGHYVVAGDSGTMGELPEGASSAASSSSSSSSQTTQSSQSYVGSSSKPASSTISRPASSSSSKPASSSSSKPASSSSSKPTSSSSSKPASSSSAVAPATEPKTTAPVTEVETTVPVEETTIAEASEAQETAE